MIHKSRMPKAIEFKHWINNYLLPKLCEVRQHNMAPAVEASPTYNHLLQELKDSRIRELEAKLAIQKHIYEKQIVDLQWRVAFSLERAAAASYIALQEHANRKTKRLEEITTSLTRNKHNECIKTMNDE